MEFAVQVFLKDEWKSRTCGRECDEDGQDDDPDVSIPHQVAAVYLQWLQKKPLAGETCCAPRPTG
jgi:hypothetical protein